jgi:hypothetical protein
MMDRFVRRENVKHYRDLLAQTKSDAQRLRIQALLDEEVKKQEQDGGDMTCARARPRVKPNGTNDFPVLCARLSGRQRAVTTWLSYRKRRQLRQ